MKSFEDFCAAMRQRESSGNYRAKNKWNFLGAYQFGMARLCDLGLTERRAGSKGFSAKHFTWKPPMSEEKFLSTPSLQDAVFEVHIGLLARRVSEGYSDLINAKERVQGLAFDLSGAVGVCHLLGEGGLAALVKGEDRADALGTTATDYLKKFTGYEIPPGLLTLADFRKRYLAP